MNTDKAMKTDEAAAFFGSRAALARALGISKQAVQQWGETVPIGRAYQIQVITRNKLKVEKNCA